MRTATNSDLAKFLISKNAKLGPGEGNFMLKKGNVNIKFNSGAWKMLCSLEYHHFSLKDKNKFHSFWQKISGQYLTLGSHKV